MENPLVQEVTYRQLQAFKPSLAVLPWGATEAHNFHLPHGTDTMQAQALAAEAAKRANQRGARICVLPAIPFGNNAQQLDQIATIHLKTSTALAILRDVIESLKQQNIRKIVILNSHGGNEFKPMVRDICHEAQVIIVVMDWWRMEAEFVRSIIEVPGDHADELETSLIMHLRPELVDLDSAGPGEKRAFAIAELSQPGVWTPRPWSRTHPDTGSGDPRRATANKGHAIFDRIAGKISDLLLRVDQTPLEQLP